MMHLPKQKRNRIILIALGTGIVVLGIWQGLISARKGKLVEYAQSALEKQEKVDNAKRVISSTNQVQSELGKAVEKLKAIEGEMASGDMYSWIIQILPNFLKTHNFQTERKVEIPQFSREVIGEIGLLPKFPYQAATFNVRGTAYFHDFGKFVAELENTYPFIRVQNVELEPAVSSKTAGPTDSEKLAFKMEIVALVNPSGR